MALDGITISSLVYELNNKLSDGRFFKIAQPENDELQITIKKMKEQYRLLISASASLPLTYITEGSKQSPLTAPNFCMVLRKHLTNAKILEITQPGLERIINIKLQHYNEMGDICEKFLIIELMGKHSNIIFTDVAVENNITVPGKIIDSIKHISANVSSVREVLPGREYFIPETTGKSNPLSSTKDEFTAKLSQLKMPVSKSIYTTFTGISPLVAEEICFLADIDSDRPANTLEYEQLEKLYDCFSQIMNIVKNHDYKPVIFFDGKQPKEYNSFDLKSYSDMTSEEFFSISSLLEHYYSSKSLFTRIRQKSVDLRRIATSALEKDYKKYEIQLHQLKDTEKREKFKIYGELLTAYGYSIENDVKSATVNNYYTNEDITIPLDETLSPMDNAKKYFDKYNKLKRTHEALSDIILETKASISHLESILNSLDIAVSEDDLKQLKEEMILSGYIRRKGSEKKSKFTSKPFHYVSTDGYDMFVGKNNLQNEELTFKVANGNDWWFHSKTFPGSHVIVKTNGDELPDRTFEEAARLAAFYSKGKEQPKVEIDYIERKHVKKVAGAKPGFVIYHTNYSMAIEPDISGIKMIQ